MSLTVPVGLVILVPLTVPVGLVIGVTDRACWSSY